MSESFINYFVAQIMSHQEQNLDVCVVIPSKRAKVFIIDAFKQLRKNVFLPKIITVEDFVEEVTGLMHLDSTSLLMEFYQYFQLNFPNDNQSFAVFTTWAKTFLYDLKDIDGYLIDTNHLFEYLQDIKALERWQLEHQESTELINKQLKFWYHLPDYYNGFYNFLIEKNLGYNGLIQREGVNKLNSFLNKSNQFFVFGGFNALNNAEQKIFQTILSEQKGQIYWDIDDFFMSEPFHLASHFTNLFKSHWAYYKNNPFLEISSHYKNNKNIFIYKTIKTIGQAKLIGNILNENNFNLNDTAIVLPDETLLLPILNHLPNHIESLNITMGYPAINNPLQFLIHDIFTLHKKAKTTKNNQALFYFKHVLSILQNPNVSELMQTTSIISYINKYNINYITFDKIIQNASHHDYEILALLFGFTFSDNKSFLENVMLIIKHIKSYKTQSQKLFSNIDLAFLFSLFQMVNQLKLYLDKYEIENDCQLLFDLYKDQVSQAQASFEGKPLQGLQIMGMLESRMLDFETVIIPSCNENILPPKARQSSIVPFDVKKENGMPTQLEQDALITYHFYRLISKAKNVFLIYDGDDGQGLNTGEKSRFIEQILFDNLPNHRIIQKSFVPKIQIDKSQNDIIKNSEVLDLLKIHAESGFSASSISNYLRNPKDFFVNNILKIKEIDEVEEDIASNTLGSIIHKTLENLYTPYLNEILSEGIIKVILSQFENELNQNFKAYFKDGDLNSGKNLIAFEISKKQINQFLQKELEHIKNGDEVVILALEKDYKIQLNDARFPFPVFLKGNLDRIEKRNGVLIVIDYKTGKVEQSQLNLTENKKLNLFNLKNEKIIQLLCYILLMKSENPNEDIKAAIISFRNINSHHLFLKEKIGKEISDFITNETLDIFENELKELIVEILNPEIPFNDIS